MKGIMLKGSCVGTWLAIFLMDRYIQFVIQQPYVSMILERNLTFYCHLKNTGANAMTLLGKINQVIKLKNGVKLAQLNFLYRTVFVLIIGYGARA